MFGSQMIEVLIGLGFLFFLLSVIVTTVREFIEGLVQTRAVHLERGIRELLRDPDGSQWAKALYAHPQISALFRGEYDPDKQLTGSWLAQLPVIGMLSRKSVMETTPVAADKAAVDGQTPPMTGPPPPGPGAAVAGVTTAAAPPAKTEWKRLQLRSNLPAYIPSRNFAAAMLDLTGRGALAGEVGDDTAPLSFARIRAGVATLPNPTLQRAMLVALDNAKGDIDKARANLEAWYDSTMDRVSGWYRKETQTILFSIGLVLAVALNVDTIRVANALSQNDTLRATIVARAQESVAAARERASGDARATLDPVAAVDPASGAPAIPADKPLSLDANAARIDALKTEIDGLGYPIGWVGPSGGNCKTGSDKVLFSQCTYSAASPFGWLITAFALTLGAPFWFDLLNKLMVIRSTVKPHEKSGEEASEDRQAPKSQALKFEVAGTRTRAAVAGSAAADDPPPEFEPHEWADGRPPQEGVI